MALRHSRNEESDRAELAVEVVRKGDIENVVRKWDAMLDTMAVARAEAQKIVMAAYEQLEEWQANALFGGSLLDALPKV